MIATTAMVYKTTVAPTHESMVNVELSSPKIKNRNGFPGKRITEFEYTPTGKVCQ
jgi:hypothetical protein